VISTAPLSDLLAPDRVALDRNLASKKSVLECAAGLLAQEEGAADKRDIFEGLCQRERLGSTALGHGVAIPHCRVSQGGVTGAFLRLNQPVDFDSPDGEGVDLFFALAVPAERSDHHLKLLASIAELFGDGDRRERIRRAADHRELVALLQRTAAPPAS